MILRSACFPVLLISPAIVNGPATPRKASVVMPKREKVSGLTSQSDERRKSVMLSCPCTSQTATDNPTRKTATRVRRKSPLITYCVVLARCSPMKPATPMMTRITTPSCHGSVSQELCWAWSSMTKVWAASIAASIPVSQEQRPIKRLQEDPST